MIRHRNPSARCRAENCTLETRAVSGYCNYHRPVPLVLVEGDLTNIGGLVLATCHLRALADALHDAADRQGM